MKLTICSSPTRFHAAACNLSLIRGSSAFNSIIIFSTLDLAALSNVSNVYHNSEGLDRSTTTAKAVCLQENWLANILFMLVQFKTPGRVGNLL